jgi:hypothetical protein
MKANTSPQIDSTAPNTSGMCGFPPRNATEGERLSAFLARLDDPMWPSESDKANAAHKLAQRDTAQGDLL